MCHRTGLPMWLVSCGQRGHRLPQAPLSTAEGPSPSRRQDGRGSSCSALQLTLQQQQHKESPFFGTVSRLCGRPQPFCCRSRLQHNSRLFPQPVAAPAPRTQKCSKVNNRHSVQAQRVRDHHAQNKTCQPQDSRRSALARPWQFMDGTAGSPQVPPSVLTGQPVSRPAACEHPDAVAAPSVRAEQGARQAPPAGPATGQVMQPRQRPPLPRSC